MRLAYHIRIARRIDGDRDATFRVGTSQVRRIHQRRAGCIDLRHKGCLVAAVVPLPLILVAIFGREILRVRLARHVHIAGGVNRQRVGRQRTSLDVGQGLRSHRVDARAAEVRHIVELGIDHERLTMVIIAQP